MSNLSLPLNSDSGQQLPWQVDRAPYSLTRADWMDESAMLTVVDGDDRVRGDFEAATICFFEDPRESHPQLFAGPSFGLLFDRRRGPDAGYRGRLEMIASLAIDLGHARRALGLTDGGSR